MPLSQRPTTLFRVLPAKLGIGIAMSPLQYQKRLRLHAARERMLIDGLDAASAALEVGYETNSIASIAASSANHLCGIFGPFARQALCPWSRSVVSKALSDRVGNKHEIAWRV